MIPLKYTSLLPLLSRKVSDLTIEDIKLIASTLGFKNPVDDSYLESVRTVLIDGNIDSLADLANNPEMIEKIRSFFSSPNSQPLGIIQCPHCLAPFLLQPQ